MKLILIALFAILNRLRGADLTQDWILANPDKPSILCPRWRIVFDSLTDKTLCCVYMGIAAGLFSYHAYGWWAILVALIVAAGTRFWAAFGWGNYFAAFDGLSKAGPEVAWIDAIIYRLIPREKNTPAWNRLRGTIGMSLRGLYLYPLFMALTIFQWFVESPQWWAPLVIGFACLLQGPVYGAMRWIPKYTTRGVPVAETIWGGVMGWLISLSL